MTQQLYTNKSKKKKLVINLFLSILFIVVITLIAVPERILASPYGENNYGSGLYGQDGSSGNSSSVSPTTDSSSSPTNTSDQSSGLSTMPVASSDNNNSSQNHKTLTVIGIIALVLSAIILILVSIARSRRKHY